MDILCLGILVADIIGQRVKRWPEKGKLELIDRVELHSGGCAANTAIDLAKPGLKVGLAGKLGNDPLGDFLLKTYRKYDLDIRGVRRANKMGTSATLVMVDSNGERSFLHAPGANKEFSLKDIDRSLLTNCKILHIAGSFLLPKLDGQPIARIFQEAKKRKIITSLDTVWDAQGRWLKLIAPVFPYLDFFLPNLEEAKMITGQRNPEKIANKLLGLGVKTVALKMGKKGCYVANRKCIVTRPAYQIKPVDTTGAGDAFAAGFLFGVIKGWPLARIVSFANAVGAMACLALGATDGVTSFRETIRFIKSLI